MAEENMIPYQQKDQQQILSKSSEHLSFLGSS